MGGEASSNGQSIHLPVGMELVPKSWKWGRLDSVCTGIYDCPHSTPKKTDAGPLMARTQDVMTGIFCAHEAAHVSEATYRERVARAEPRFGDLLYSREGTYFGVAAEVPSDCRVCLGQRMVLLRPETRFAYHSFLRYWLNSPIMSGHIHGFRDGTVAERLNLPTIRGLPVLLPPLAEQKAIAHILGTLDEKIELNRRMNETLEGIARAVFKSWFVDFDPVRAKLDGRQPEGMDAETAALFPDGFEETENGKVPLGWNCRPLSGLVHVIKGRSYKSSELAESTTALVTLKSIQRGGGYRPDGLKPFTGTFKPEQKLVPGELVVSFTDVTQAADVIGKPAIVRRNDNFETLVASLDLGIVRPTKPHITVPYLYCAFMSDDFQNHAYSHCTGTTVLHLSKAAIPEYMIACPPDQLIKRFSDLAGPTFQAIEENEQESQTLSALRDTLLPKLLSGEIRVGEAAELVGEG